MSLLSDDEIGESYEKTCNVPNGAWPWSNTRHQALWLAFARDIEASVLAKTPGREETREQNVRDRERVAYQYGTSDALFETQRGMLIDRIQELCDGRYPKSIYSPSVSNARRIRGQEPLHHGGEESNEPGEPIPVDASQLRRQQALIDIRLARKGSTLPGPIPLDTPWRWQETGWDKGQP